MKATVPTNSGGNVRGFCTLARGIPLIVGLVSFAIAYTRDIPVVHFVVKGGGGGAEVNLTSNSKAGFRSRKSPLINLCNNSR